MRDPAFEYVELHPHEFVFIRPLAKAFERWTKSIQEFRITWRHHEDFRVMADLIDSVGLVAVKHGPGHVLRPGGRQRNRRYPHEPSTPHDSNRAQWRAEPHFTHTLPQLRVKEFPL